MSTEANKVLERRFVEEILTKGEMTAAPELVAEDCVEWNPLPGQPPGREGMIGLITMMHTAFPDVQWTIEELIGEEQKVAASGTWHGTHRGMFFGIPPTGKKVTVKWLSLDTCVDGRLKESRFMMETMGLMQQLGVIPPMGTER